jgi:pimeloyl-ACP methyl ester carboxylesterase
MLFAATYPERTKALVLFGSWARASGDSRDAFVDVRHGRYIAEHIPGARYVELGGEDHLPLAGDTDAVDKEIEGFVSGLTGFGWGDQIQIGCWQRCFSLKSLGQRSGQLL